VPPEELFGHYLYLSSFSDTMVRHAEALVERLVAERGLGPASLAAEVASNDGYLLQFYRRAGVPVLGIEPAANIARVAEEERGVRTVCEFFGAELAARLAAEGHAADVVHANNVLAHVADLNGVVEGFRTLLKPGGTTSIEVPYVKDMIDGTEFDTIYHEHLCYFSLTALGRLFRRHGLVIWNVERLPIHGGSLRVFATPADAAPEPAEAVRALLAAEQGWGVDRPEFYLGFAERVERLKRELSSLVARLKREGKRIAAYGASAKGSTLLNYFGIGRETLDFVADRSTVKQGRFTPGTHLPIRAPGALLEEQPDYVLLLTWNFADEILAQQDEYRRRGGRFIVPIPELRVV
jgi:SAM-dependent methyltransferase